MKAGFGLRGLSRWLESGRRDVPAFLPPASVYTAPPELTPPPAAAWHPAAPSGPQPPADAPEDRRQALTAAFNPAHPVQRRRDLCGRDDKLAALFEAMLNQGKHAIVHGARGSGKTSLVHVFGDYADQRGAVVIYMACEEGASFGEIVRHFAQYIPTDELPPAQQHAFAQTLAALDDTSRPRAFVELFSLLGQRQVIFILDEFDRVNDARAQNEIATFMKLLSDAHAPVQLLVVGIARSVSDIIDCHPSLRRHLVAIAVGRISREDVGLLVDQGAARAGLRFDPPARELMVRTSCGSPYHARLFAHAAGLQAIRRGRDIVDVDAAQAGLADATEDWARLNEADSQLFRNLAGQPPAMRRRLADIARVAAIGDGFTRNSVIDERGSNEQMEGALDGALVSDVRDISRKIFRDTLAPQFLLATIELAEAEEQRRHASPPHVAPYARAEDTTYPVGIDWQRGVPPAPSPSSWPAASQWQDRPAAPAPPATAPQSWPPVGQGWPTPSPPPAAQWGAASPAVTPWQSSSQLHWSTAAPASPPPVHESRWPTDGGWQAAPPPVTNPLPPPPSLLSEDEPPTYPTEPYKPYVPPPAGDRPPPRGWSDPYRR